MANGKAAPSGICQRVFELRADTIGKLDRAERRDPVETSSEVD